MAFPISPALPIKHWSKNVKRIANRTVIAVSTKQTQRIHGLLKNQSLNMCFRNEQKFEAKLAQRKRRSTSDNKPKRHFILVDELYRVKRTILSAKLKDEIQQQSMSEQEKADLAELLNLLQATNRQSTNNKLLFVETVVFFCLAAKLWLLVDPKTQRQRLAVCWGFELHVFYCFGNSSSSTHLFLHIFGLQIYKGKKQGFNHFMSLF